MQDVTWQLHVAADRHCNTLLCFLCASCCILRYALPGCAPGAGADPPSDSWLELSRPWAKAGKDRLTPHAVWRSIFQSNNIHVSRATIKRMGKAMPNLFQFSA